MKRRQWLVRFSGMVAAAVAGPSIAQAPSARAGTAAVAAVPKLVKTRAQWRALLPAESYRVLFEEGTERAGSSALDREKRSGSFVCAACFLPLFDSATRYDSGTGWPSFFDHLPGVFGTRRDFKLVIPRTEYHCIRCAGHQGHVFNDGPKPTGLRYCNNGVALHFVPRGEPLPALRT
jgi:peptide-methionine (R)-S-oxide reductase